MLPAEIPVQAGQDVAVAVDVAAHPEVGCQEVALLEAEAPPHAPMHPCVGRSSTSSDTQGTQADQPTEEQFLRSADHPSMPDPVLAMYHQDSSRLHRVEEWWVEEWWVEEWWVEVRSQGSVACDS